MAAIANDEFMPIEFDSASGSSPADKVKSLIASHPVIMFSKSTCPFCFELKRALKHHGVSFAVVEVNKSSNMSGVQDALQEISQIRTVPNLFLGGRSVGGCIDFKSKEFTGEFLTLLAPYLPNGAGGDVESGRGDGAADLDHLQSTLFYFPETVNGHVARFSGLYTSIVAILCTIFYHNPVTPWVVLSLAIDFALRLVFGSTHSFIGALAQLSTSHLAPKFVAGPPKQFAALCGIFFSTFSAGLFLARRDVGGAIVVALLAGAAALEGVLDFCLGCWMFGLFIQFGIVSPSIYRPYLSLRDRKQWAYAFTHPSLVGRWSKAHREGNTPVDYYQNQGHVFSFPASGSWFEKVHVLLPGQVTETARDLIRKIRPELEFKIQDVSMVRHVTIDIFAAPMAVLSLSYLFETTNQHSAVVFDTGYASMVLGIISIIFAGIFGLAYLLRGFLYPQKVWKEWNHPITSQYFSCLNILTVLFGLLIMSRNAQGGVSLVWIGGIAQMILTLHRLSCLFYERLSTEYFSPALLMTPVGNLIVAIGFGRYAQYYPDAPNYHGHVHYEQLARLWFATAVFFGIVFFIISLHQVMQESFNDARTRPLLWIYLAAFAAVGPAMLAVSVPAANVSLLPEYASGITYQCLWCIALIFFSVLSLGWVRNWYNVMPYDNALWMVPFAMTIFAIHTVQYYSYNSDNLFLVLALITTATASATMAITALQMLNAWWDRGTLFTPRPKWGPVSFMKLTHEALRVALPRMDKQIDGLHTQVQDGNASVTGAVIALVKEFHEMVVTFDMHSQHEDKVLFPAARRFFPELNQDADHEHEGLHETLHRFEQIIAEFKAAPAESRDAAAATFLAALKPIFHDWVISALRHLRNEEETITVVVRKYVPLAYQKELTAQAYNLDLQDARNPQGQWATTFGFVLHNLPVLTWQVRYVRTFIWAQPERAQEIGLTLHRVLDPALFWQLAQEIPEMIPRGLPGFHRIY